jgi:hypothetical protein
LFDEMIVYKVFDTIIVHNRVKPLFLHDALCQVDDDLNLGQVFEEMPMHQVCFQITLRENFGLLYKNMY